MGARAFCDRTAALARPGQRAARPRLIVAATILASSLDFTDGSVINVGLPAIGRSLQADAAALQWAVNGYMLPLSALLLLGGALGDRFGKRRMLVAGLAGFAAGSAACAAAPSLAWLILARAFQGVAAAVMLPSSLAVLGDSFEGPARNRAVGLWAAAGAITAALGPVLGGWLVDTVGWRAIFLINLPLAGTAATLALYAIAPAKSAASGASLDLAGAALITAALTGLTWGLTEGAGRAGWTPAAVAAVVAGLALLAGFVAREARQGDAAMTPPALFGARPLAALNLLTLLLYGALTGFMLLLPYLLITSAGYSATAAGAALLPFPVVMALGSPAMGALAGRIGARGPLIAGALLVAAGCLLALRAGARADYVTVVLPAVIAIALGMACAAAPLTAAVLSAVDARHTGAASGLNSALAQLGGVAAVALIGGVLAARGAAFVAAFHVAAMVGAGVALAAAATIAFLYKEAHRAGAAPASGGSHA
jgi:EmrB/QacA subfamily drug resistance transporter